jgi:NhaP-type Na+/H+ or K+/H+ antiporter
MWFGPKGFASVVYGLLVLEAAIPGADEVFHLVALTIVLSILAHSSTDIIVARTFERAGGGWREALRAAAGRPPPSSSESN